MRAFDKTAAKCFKEWIFTASGGILHSCSGFTLNLTGVTGFSCFFIYRLTSGEERTSDGVIPEPNWDKQQHEEPSISGVATLVWSAVVRRRQIFAPPKRIVADASICSDSLPPPPTKIWRTSTVASQSSTNDLIAIANKTVPWVEIYYIHFFY